MYVCVCMCAWVRETEQEVKCEGLVFVALSNDFSKELLWEKVLRWVEMLWEGALE